MQQDGKSNARMPCRYVLKNASRDWSAEGAPERSQSYGRICDEVLKRLPLNKQQNDCRVLVPGCGLGRLPYMLASLGYQAEVVSIRASFC